MECANSIFASYTYKVGKCLFFTLTFQKVSSNPGDESSPKGTEKNDTDEAVCLFCCYIRNLLSADVIGPSALHPRTCRDKNHPDKSEI